MSQQVREWPAPPLNEHAVAAVSSYNKSSDLELRTAELDSLTISF